MGTAIVGWTKRLAARHAVSLGCWLAVAALSACARHHAGGRAGGNSGASSAESSGGQRSGSKPPDGPACVATELVAEIAVPVQQVLSADVLFVIDDSGGLAEEQASLADQFPRFIERMIGPGGLPISSLHLAVVSSDLGLAGLPEIKDCNATVDQPDRTGSSVASGTHSSDASRVGDPCSVPSAEGGFDPRGDRHAGTECGG